ncbi:MAG: hypothetical protein A3K09_06655 [Nitrospinae bacterium RIFCSPLOWO2_12_FULL_47_7]|nr:MAG: hypothetical protein A3K09_06655 [Nitrospinae bacterium RIFCSPLOWO2_12_FULL_47_7]
MIKKMSILKEEENAAGKRLKSWRKSESLTLMKLGALIGISQSSLSELENGKSLPSAGTLRGLCLKTDLDLYWLLTGEGSMSRKDATGEVPLPSGLSVILQDRKLRDLVMCLIRIYQHRDTEKTAHLYGFLHGADPGGD